MGENGDDHSIIALLLFSKSTSTPGSGRWGWRDFPFPGPRQRWGGGGDGTQQVPSPRAFSSVRQGGRTDGATTPPDNDTGLSPFHFASRGGNDYSIISRVTMYS